MSVTTFLAIFVVVVTFLCTVAFLAGLATGALFL
jgi:hypothetical protein